MPLVGDDFVLLNQSNGIQTLLYSYKSWNARFYEMLYGTYIVRLNPYIFDFLNAILGAMFVLGLFVLLFWDFRRKFNFKDIFLLCVLIFLLCTATAFEAIFLWGDGSANYLWGGVGIIFIMLHIKIFLLQKFGAKIATFAESKSTIFALLLLSLTSAMSNETFAVFGIFAYIALFLVCKFCKITLPFYYKISFVLFVLGLLYLIIAPGTNARIATEIARYDYLSLGELWHLSLGDKVARIYLVLNNFATQTPLILPLLIFSCAFFQIYNAKILYKNITLFVLVFCLFCVILVENALGGIAILIAMQCYIFRTNPTATNKIILIALCVWIALAFTQLQFAKNLPLRARSADLILLICICLLYLKTYKFSKKIMAVFCGAMLIFFAYTIYQYADLRVKWNALVEFVEVQKKIYGENAEISYSAEKFKIDYFMISTFFKPSKANKDLEYFGLNYVFGVKSVKFE